MTRLIPVTRAQARAFVGAHHRHNEPHNVAICQVGLELDGELVGVAVLERPKSRILCERHEHIAEISRVCVRDGVSNACSRLYGALARVAAGLGYDMVITYTLVTESGASLKAAGFQKVGDPVVRAWDKKRRNRQQKMPWMTKLPEGVPRVRWERRLRTS